MTEEKQETEIKRYMLPPTKNTEKIKAQMLDDSNKLSNSPFREDDISGLPDLHRPSPCF